MSDTTKQDKKDKRGLKPKRRGPRYFGFWPLVKVLFFLVLMAFGVFVLSGKSVAVPDWVRAKVSEQLKLVSSNAETSFSSIFLNFDHEFRPNFTVTSLERRNENGEIVARAALMRASLSKSALLRGEFHPRQIMISGLELSVLRKEDGSLDFGGDVGVQGVDPAGDQISLTNVMEAIDRVFSIPEMNSLETVEATDLTIAFDDNRAERSWLVTKGRFDLIHQNQRVEMNVGFDIRYGNEKVATTEFSFEKKIGVLAASIGAKVDGIPARDLASQIPALAWLNVLEAPISGAMRARIGKDGFISRLDGTLEIGKGLLKPSETARAFAFNSGRVYFGFDAKKQKIIFNELSVNTAAGSLVLEGASYLRDLVGGIPQALVGQFKILELSANPDGVFAQPVTLSGGAIDLKLELAPFSLSLGQFNLSDGQYFYRAKGDVTVKEDGWHVAIDAKADSIEPKRLLELWPLKAIPPTRKWLSDNVHAGEINNIVGALRIAPGQKPIYGLSFEFEKADVRFMRYLPPVKDGKGHASIFGDVFTLVVSEGHVTADQGGYIDPAGTVFTIPNINQKPAPAEVTLNARGSITAALSLLNQRPLEIMTKANQPVDLAQGTAEVKGEISLILARKIEDQKLTYDLGAVLHNVSTDTLVPNKVLRAERLVVTATPKQVVISGKGFLGHVPIQGAWRQSLSKGSPGRSRVEGTIELSQRFVTEFGIGLPKGSVYGAGLGRIEIDFKKGTAPKFHLISDLNRVGLKIPEVAWSLPKNTPGRLEVSGTLGPVPEISALILEGAGLKTRGVVTLTKNGGLKSAKFARVRLAGWLDAAVEFVGRGKNRNPDVVVSGGTINLGRTSFGVSSGDRASRNTKIILKLNKMFVTDGIVLNNFRGEFDTRRGVNGNFTSGVNGGAKISGTVIPSKGGSAVRITSSDAGGVYRAAGMLDHAFGGTLDMTLIPRAGEPGSYDGRITGEKIKIIGAPAIAGLLGAISIVGLLEQLDGKGIAFSKYEGDFRLTPQKVTVTSASAIGASLGISMDGVYMMEESTIDMRGVISPIYLLNGAGSVLTRKGEGLIGFNYHMFGPADGPKIRVNPLSILTPGMFRNLFRKPPPKLAP